MFFPEGVDNEESSSYTQQQREGMKREKIKREEMKPVGRGGGRVDCMLEGKLVVRIEDETGANQIRSKHCQQQSMSTFISGHTAEILPC
jgi:hypothetical protein